MVMFVIMATIQLPHFIVWLLLRICANGKRDGEDLIWPERLKQFPAPFVRNYSVFEAYDFAVWRGIVYVKGILEYTCRFIYNSIVDSETFTYLSVLPDDKLAEILTESQFCKHISDVVDDAITKQMLDTTGIQREEIHYMMDNVEYIGQFQELCLPQFYICGSRALLEKTGGVDGVPIGVKLRAIFLTARQNVFNDDEYFRDDINYSYDPEHEKGFVYTPEDGSHWNNAKLHFLQSHMWFGLLMIHPSRHFPLDSVNAITRTMLPKNHIIDKILTQHSRFALSVERSVVDSSYTVLRNVVMNPIAVAPFKLEHARLVSKSYMRNYNFETESDMLIPGQEFIFNEMLKQYYDCLFKFICKVLKNQYMCPFSQQWATCVSRWVPGFPDGEAIANGNDNLLLEKTVTSYIFTVSIGHSADHRSFITKNYRGDLVTLDNGVKRFKRLMPGSEAIFSCPVRMRIPPPLPTAVSPNRKGVVAIDGTESMVKTKFKACTKYDMLKQYLFYFVVMNNSGNPFLNSLLADVDYEFEQDEFKRYNVEFREDLKEAHEFCVRNHIDLVHLNDFANSIEF